MVLKAESNLLMVPYKRYVSLPLELRGCQVRFKSLNTTMEVPQPSDTEDHTLTWVTRPLLPYQLDLTPQQVWGQQ